jgi:hypothetical protein
MAEGWVSGTSERVGKEVVVEYFKGVQRNLSRASAEIKTACVRKRGLAEIPTRCPVNMKQESHPLDCNGNGDIRFQPLTFTMGTVHSQSSALPARNARAANHAHRQNVTAAKSQPIQTAYTSTYGALVSSFNITNLCILTNNVIMCKR